ncbi:MAG: DNA glycosylase [Eubacteriales bacterium]|nr:DNA glycosylase [Eubacteriales bacterium]
MSKMIKTINDFSPAAIAESGQCFRMTKTGENEYSLIAFGKKLSVTEEGGNEFGFSCTEEEFEKIWRHYFDLDTDYEQYKRICLPEDEFLKEAIEFGNGIRILNQDPYEMLISFIISQRKSVPAIRTSIERLSSMLGEDGAFPNPARLAQADTDILSSCGLGYRVEYVRNAAEEVAAGSLNLNELNEYPTPLLIEKLMELKGVGIKVASCIALFGYHRLDTVPVDVWMKRVIDIKYGGSLPEEYEKYAGVLQQYMFNYARLRGVSI